MGLFICDICHTIENTGQGSFWDRNDTLWQDVSLNGKALCSACTPTTYADGTAVRDGGRWHGRFARTIATEALLLQTGLSRFNYLGPFSHLWDTDS